MKDGEFVVDIWKYLKCIDSIIVKWIDVIWTFDTKQKSKGDMVI